MAANVETNVVSVERIKEYTETEQVNQILNLIKYYKFVLHKFIVSNLDKRL